MFRLWGIALAGGLIWRAFVGVVTAGLGADHA